MKTIFLSILILSFSINEVSANPPMECKENGCGSKWNTLLVPDRIDLLKINFTKSCNRHDKCYGLCIPACGENIGTPKCSESGRKERKAICDSTFLKDMKNSCTKKIGIQKYLCENLAIRYLAAVKALGWSSFYGYEKPKDEHGLELPAQTNPIDIMSHEAQKHYLDNKPSELIEAINRAGFDKARKIEQLFEEKEQKPSIQQENFLNNYFQRDKEQESKLGNKASMEQFLKPGHSNFERIQIENAVRELER